MPRLSIELNGGTYKRFCARCGELGRSHAEVVRALIESWLETPTSAFEFDLGLVSKKLEKAGSLTT